MNTHTYKHQQGETVLCKRMRACPTPRHTLTEPPESGLVTQSLCPRREEAPFSGPATPPPPRPSLHAPSPPPPLHTPTHRAPRQWSSDTELSYLQERGGGPFSGPATSSNPLQRYWLITFMFYLFPHNLKSLFHDSVPTATLILNRCQM